MQMDIQFDCSSGIQTQTRRIHKWCLDQLTSDILQVVLMKIANVQEMIFIDKSNKWFHAKKIPPSGITFLNVVSLIQDNGSTSDPQL